MLAPPIILDFQLPVSIRLARDIGCHIIPSGLALFRIEAGSTCIRFSGVASKCATPDSGYPTFLVVAKMDLANLHHVIT